MDQKLPLPLQRFPASAPGEKSHRIFLGGEFPTQIFGGVEAELLLCSEGTALAQPPLCSGWVPVEFRGGILQSADRAGIMQGMAEGACSHSLSAMNSLPEEAWAEISALQVPLAGKRSFGQPQTPKTTAVQGKGSFRGSLGLPFSPRLMDGSCLVCAAPRSNARGSAAPCLVPFDGVCVFQASGILARREGGTRRIPCLGWDGAGEFKL